MMVSVLPPPPVSRTTTRKVKKSSLRSPSSPFTWLGAWVTSSVAPGAAGSFSVLPPTVGFTTRMLYSTKSATMTAETAVRAT